MPVFSREEEEQLLEKVVDSYLAKADTASLYEAFSKNAAETKALREELKGKCQSVTNLQADVEKLRTTVEEVNRANTDLRASHIELKSVADKFQGANDELRTVNTDLRSKQLELQIKVDAIQTKLEALQNNCDKAHGFNVSLRTRLEQTETQKSTAEKALSDQQSLITQMQLRLAMCESNVGDCEHRVDTCEMHKKDCEKFQNLSVRAVEKLEQKFTKLVESGKPSFVHLTMRTYRCQEYDKLTLLCTPALSASRTQEHIRDKARQRLQQNHQEYSDEGCDSQEEDLHLKEGEDALDNDVDPTPEEENELDPRETRGKRKKRKLESPPIGKPRQKRSRAAPNSIPKPEQEDPQQEESCGIVPPQPELPDRALRILDHWDAARERYNKNTALNARSLIWQFIDATGDLEFSEWIQRYLLRELPKLVSIRANRTSNPLRIVGLERKITWDDFKQVFLNIDDLPPFMRDDGA